MSRVAIRAALETAQAAINNIVPAVAITSSSVASPTVITTATPHGLPIGAVVLTTITNHVGSTPALSGVYRATATGASTLTLQTNAATPANVSVSVGGAGGSFRPSLTAYENVAFTPPSSPPPGVPYEAVAVLFARPVNNEFSANYRQDGFMQVTLRYPVNTGPGAAAARAELIAATFKRGASFTSAGITVTITDQLEVMPGFVDGDRWAVPCRSRFTAHVSA